MEACVRCFREQQFAQTRRLTGNNNKKGLLFVVELSSVAIASPGCVAVRRLVVGGGGGGGGREKGRRRRRTDSEVVNRRV